MKNNIFRKIGTFFACLFTTCSLSGCVGDSLIEQIVCYKNVAAEAEPVEVVNADSKIHIELPKKDRGESIIDKAKDAVQTRAHKVKVTVYIDGADYCENVFIIDLHDEGKDETRVLTKQMPVEKVSADIMKSEAVAIETAKDDGDLSKAYSYDKSWSEDGKYYNEYALKVSVDLEKLSGVRGFGWMKTDKFVFKTKALNLKGAISTSSEIAIIKYEDGIFKTEKVDSIEDGEEITDTDPETINSTGTN